MMWLTLKLASLSKRHALFCRTAEVGLDLYRLIAWLPQVSAPNPRLPGGYDLNYMLFNLTGPEAARRAKICVVSEQYAPLVASC